MNCTECLDLINSYLDGELGDGLRSEIKSHLGGCPDCSHEAARWQNCFDWLRQGLPERMPPARLWREMWARMKAVEE